MKDTILDKASGYLADSAEQASRAAATVSEALDDGTRAARHVVRRGRDAATDALQDAARQIRRKPIATAVGVFAAGVTVGLIVGWIARKT
jgi:ElaB/YqjD/DUF883 family membrane-anchored ribosome-binding protein